MQPTLNLRSSCNIPTWPTYIVIIPNNARPSIHESESNGLYFFILFYFMLYTTVVIFFIIEQNVDIDGLINNRFKGF